MTDGNYKNPAYDQQRKEVDFSAVIKIHGPVIGKSKTAEKKLERFVEILKQSE